MNGNMGYQAIFVSPHLDDAVLSAGGLLAKMAREKKRLLLVTVFTSGIDKKRITEDKKVCRKLGIDFEHWNEVDAAKRRGGVNEQSLLERLKTMAINSKNAEWYFPLGIGGHIDHQLVNKLAVKLKIKKKYFWEDYPYKMFTSSQQELLLKKKRFVLKKAIDVGEYIDEKKQLIETYSSQMGLIFGSKPMFLANLEKFYKLRTGGNDKKWWFLSDELEGGAKKANDCLLAEIMNSRNRGDFDFMEQVFRKDRGGFLGTKRWFWSMWSYKKWLETAGSEKMTILTTSPNLVMAAYWLKKQGKAKKIKIYLLSHGDRSYFSKKTANNKGVWAGIYYRIYCWWYRVWERISGGIVAGVITSSEFHAEIMRRKLGWKTRQKIKVIKLGVNRNRFFDDLAPREKVVAYVGRIDPQKGILELAEAMKKVNGAKLWLVVPSGEDNHYLRKVKIELEKISGKVFSPRNDQELAEIYRKIGVVVLASEIENSPMVMLEALASGCGFIGSKVGNMPELLGKFDKEMIIEEITPESILRTINKFFNYSKKERDLQKKKVNKLLSGYNWKKAAKLILKNVNQNGKN